MTDKDKHPLEASYGGDNTHILGCEVYNGRRHYAVCLRIITRHEENNPHTWEPDCNRAISRGQCPALALRAKEEKAGHALFYQPREKSPMEPLPRGVSIFDIGYQRGWRQVGEQKPSNQSRMTKQPAPKPAPKSKPKAGSDFDFSHERLVNKMMEDEKNAKQQRNTGSSDADSGDK